VLLGLSLCAALAGGWGYWQESYVKGQETCTRCGLRRDVDRRGRFWFRSEPHASRLTPEPTVACSGHVWVEGGCWREDGMGIYRAPVVVKR
jgi:hypothetical protein